MGRTWHPEHFVCTHCQEEIGSRNFFERDGQPYCEKDYHTLFSPRCHYCNGPILDVSAGQGGGGGPFSSTPPSAGQGAPSEAQKVLSPAPAHSWDSNPGLMPGRPPTSHPTFPLRRLGGEARGADSRSHRVTASLSPSPFLMKWESQVTIEPVTSAALGMKGACPHVTSFRASSSPWC